MKMVKVKVKEQAPAGAPTPAAPAGTPTPTAAPTPAAAPAPAAASAAPAAAPAPAQSRPTNTRRLTAATWAARVCFGVVFCWNVLCAVQFMLWPADYAPGFGLSGQAGNVAIAGLGIAFLMWNATFPAFIVYPTRFMCLGVVAIVQQIIGIAGEDWILLGLAARMHLDAAIERFLFFDVTGLLLMAASFTVLARASAWKYSPFGRKHR